MASIDRECQNFNRLVSASPSVKFENAKRPRMVKVRTPNVTNFNSKEDSHLIETWLQKRGFVNEQKEAEEDSAQPVTHQDNHDAVSKSPPWYKLTDLSGGKDVKAEWQDFPEDLLAITNEQPL